MTVLTTYTLSPIGQRAAIIAGGSGAVSQTVTLDATPEQLAHPAIAIAADGSMSLALAGVHNAPINDLATALAIADAARSEAETQNRNEHDELERLLAVYEAGGECHNDLYYKCSPDMAARRAAERARRENAHEREMIAESIAALPPAKTVGEVQNYCYAHGYHRTSIEAIISVLGAERVEAMQAAEALNHAAEKAQADEKAAQLAADAELGIHYFAVEGGMCNFTAGSRRTETGEEIETWHRGWATYDEKHWLGVFSSARGVDRFVNGPRGERCYDVSGLRAGECIQQASYDVSSRGKRRSEVESFGVVASHTDVLIGIYHVDSRAAALKIARKL